MVGVVGVGAMMRMRIMSDSTETLLLAFVIGGAIFGLIYWWVEVYTPKQHMKQAIREANEMMKRYPRRPPNK